MVNGVGIKGMSELLSLSANTVLKRIISIANKIKKPIISLKQKYEVDEMRTFVGNKNNQTWIVYGINSKTKEVADFSVGRRTNRTLNKVISTLLLSEASQLITDKLSNYGFLIPKDIHNTKNRGTNHIERKNLTLRTHLKRLNRKTICFSKSKIILSACLKIYFWG
ncbi:MAG: IS1 family transposase [Bacteroidia bacterium]